LGGTPTTGECPGIEDQKRYDTRCYFITADPGHAPADKPRGDQARTRRSKEGTWTKKNSESQFGFKVHSKEDCDYGLIWELQTSTASLHDSQIDLSKGGEVVYRDKGYFGVKPLGFDATMKRGVRNHPIGIWDKLRNKRISRKRSPGERPYAVIKTVSNRLIPWSRLLQEFM
jgi:transposase, IS5 family